MAIYDVKLIKDTIKQFKENRCGQPVTILFDADNTLYQFSTYRQEQLATRAMYTQNFFKNLPIFTEAPNVVENLQRLGFRCGIVTQLIDSPFCAMEKLQSFEYYFPMISTDDIYLVPPGVSKSEIIKEAYGSLHDVILIDDYYVNINDWYSNGGIAIKKSYSGKLRPVPVITSLIDLFYVLHDLNAY